MNANPYREAATKARAIADRLNGTTAQDEAMRDAFPLGAGYGHGSQRSRDRRIDARVNRATKAVAAERKAKGLEAMADRYDRGEVLANGRTVDPARQARSDKRAAAAKNKAERIAAAQAAIEGKDPMDVDPETWATAHGYVGGTGRDLVMHDHAERIAARG